MFATTVDFGFNMELAEFEKPKRYGNESRFVFGFN